MHVTFKFKQEETEKVVVSAKLKSHKTWDDFVEFILTTHPNYSKYQKEYYQKLENEKAPWEKEEFLKNVK